MDMMADSVREFDSRIALEFFGAQYQLPASSARRSRAPPAGCARSASAAVTGWRWCCRTARNTSSRSMRSVPRRDRGRAQSALHPVELRRQFEDHGATVAIVWDKVAATVQSFPAAMGVATVVSVDLTKAMPRVKRLALRLPLAKAAAARAALSAGAATGTIAWSSLSQISSPNPQLPAPETG